MKKIGFSVGKLMFGLLLLANLTGCALYGSEAQYRDGDHYWLAGSREMARIQQDKLAFQKLQSQGVINSGKPESEPGYLGLISNISKGHILNFKIYGPENKSWFVDPMKTEKAYLIPGTYYFIIENEYGNRVAGPKAFHVNAQTHNYRGQKCHWYIYQK